MIVTIKRGADETGVRRALIARGLWVQPFERGAGDGERHLAIEPHSAAATPESLLLIEGVSAVSRLPSAHPLMDRQGPQLVVAGVAIGAAEPVLMAGPCSAESEGQVRALAARLAPLGVRFLRGGAYKPRTSPYSFQGHGVAALGWLRRAADEHGMGLVTEAMSEAEVGPVAEHADLIQIGSRNMYNSPLLNAAGRSGRAVLLKRGMTATIEEWLCAAEYCLLAGAAGVVLCERGVRGFDPSTRNLLDLGAVALLAQVQRAPVMVDPSHAVGRRDLIPALSRAALAAGAAGLMIEVHADPGSALSDGPQALLPEQLAALIEDLRRTHALARP